MSQVVLAVTLFHCKISIIFRKQLTAVYTQKCLFSLTYKVFFYKVFNSQIRVSFTALNICHFTVQNFHTFLLYNNDDIQFFVREGRRKKCLENILVRFLKFGLKLKFKFWSRRWFVGVFFLLVFLSQNFNFFFDQIQA